MNKQVLVSVDRGETRVALLEATGTPAAKPTRGGRGRRKANPTAGYRVAELYLERRGNRSIVGNIYKGKVDNVLPGLEAAFVLSMYALIVWRGLRILTMSKNLLGALIAGGLVCVLLFEVFVNVGMNVGIMPITGIPLPLFSYGGSSVLTTFLAVGLLQSIYAQGRAAASLKGRVLAL